MRYTRLCGCLVLVSTVWKVCDIALHELGFVTYICLDFLAHSNYTELALIEMGERDVFPHVGRDTLMQLQGARDEVYPLVTGTFGGVDFLHSVTGEGTSCSPYLVRCTI